MPVRLARSVMTFQTLRRLSDRSPRQSRCVWRLKNRRDSAQPEHIGDHTHDIELLERLARLREQGILGPEEFAAKKAEILDRM